MQRIERLLEIQAIPRSLLRGEDLLDPSLLHLGVDQVGASEEHREELLNRRDRRLLVGDVRQANQQVEGHGVIGDLAVGLGQDLAGFRLRGEMAPLGDGTGEKEPQIIQSDIAAAPG